MARITPLLHPIRLAIAVALAAIVAMPQTGYARSCALPWPSPADASARAAAVFRGTVTNVENLRSGRTTFLVSTAWKGTITSEMVVYAGSNNISTYYPFRPGTEYVVYANRSVSGSIWNVPENSIVVDICTRTLPVSQANADLAALGPGQPPLPVLPPAVGQGFAAGPASQRILGILVIIGSLLVFLARIVRVSNGSIATDAARHP